MKFAVTILEVPGFPHTEAVREVAETLHYGLVELGYDSVLTPDLQLPERQYIVLASCALVFQRSFLQGQFSII
jgi:hypothetical protein